MDCFAFKFQRMHGLTWLTSKMGGLNWSLKSVREIYINSLAIDLKLYGRFNDTNS